MSKKAMLYEKLDNQLVHCFLCAHHCKIAPLKFGFCGVRQNIEGELITHAYGKIIAANIDPVEKKPLYHFLPGTYSYSIATIGCNFRCGFCQNWQISQASPHKDGGWDGLEMKPENIVKEAKINNCKSISYTYTEPTIFFEYAFDTAILARKEGLGNVFVTNGFMTEEALVEISPYLDAANVDLKSFSDASYRKVCRGKLQPVLDTIVSMKRKGVWVEITTLVIPGENDSEEELGNIAKFIADTGKDIPWHISRFHPDYQFMDHNKTPIDTLKMAEKIGKSHGLQYVYMGNVSEDGNTYCPKCNNLLLSRRGYSVGIEGLKKGLCSKCSSAIEGRW